MKRAYRLKQDWSNAARLAAALTVSLLAANRNAVGQTAQSKIIHDAEYYVLDAQHVFLQARYDR